MLINFAVDVLGTTVTSDKVSTDGYECSNLISSNWHLRRKGFIGEHFIKPPVNITFQFPCRVNIQQVLLSPNNGQQKSSQIELYSASKPSTKAVSSRHHDWVNQHTQHKSTVSASPDSPIFYAVSKITVSNADGICFRNPKFDGTSTNKDSSNSFVSFSHTAIMQHFRKELLSASTHLTIRIIRTQNGSAAALSNIDIWGQPALSVPLVIQQEIVKKYVAFIKPVSPSQKKKVESNNSASASNLRSVSLKEDHELDIPEDFIDSLTCEVMAVPMLLPSGKNVDLSTLDRFYNSEASHGRKARDPFTGVEFSDKNRPVPNGALKVRIDQFLMKHVSDKATATIARTVGEGKSTSLLGKRKAVEGNILHGVSSLISSPISCSDPLECRTDFEVDTASEVRKLKRRVTSTETKSSNSIVSGQSNDFRQDRHCVEMCGIVDSCRKTTFSHESNLKDSLNDALSSVLGTLNSYSSNICTEENVEDKDKCSLCKHSLAVESMTYIFPCGHTVCRDCLTVKYAGFATIQCGVCGKKFERKDLMRKHNKVW